MFLGSNHPSNILNYISHDKNGNLNDINFEKTQYIRKETIHSGLIGSYGGIVDNIFENSDTKNQIIISEKIMRTHIRKSGGSLEELKLLKNYPYLLELCPHIIPIKILDDKVYMLRGNGDLNKLIQSTEIDINAGIAHQIVNCIKKTLLCLLNHNIYYFDLKPGNIIYQCFNDTMYIWIIDLGSMIPDKYGAYLATYPHPTINSKSLGKNSGYITRTVMGKNLRIEKSHELIKSIYAYQLSQLFFNLIGLNKEFSYEAINTKDSFSLSIDLHIAIKKLKDKKYENKLTEKYIGVFNEIIKNIDLKSRSVTVSDVNHKNFWL